MLNVLIDKNKCKACGLCAAVCPKGIIHIDLDEITAYGRGCASVKGECIGCGSCYTVCPDIAITIGKDDDK